MDLRDQLQGTLGDSYRLGRELGGGGMARVFVAEDTSLGREIVVKVLPPELAAEVNVERFRREIQVAAQLQHACIVPLLSAGIANGIPYFTMPFVKGESLRARLQRERELPIGETVRILRDVLAALSCAHESGIVHRDIKPDNVLLTRHHALVADFGVAKALTAAGPGGFATSVGIALGTPAYMSPEQASADPLTDHRTDIYAVAAMGYEMLTGRQLFAGRSPQAMIAAHAVETPDAIERWRQAVPRELADLITRGLAKIPADRPQSADEMLALLDAAAANLATPTSSVAGPGISRARTFPRPAHAGIAAAVAGLGVLLFFAVRGTGNTASGKSLPVDRVAILASAQTAATSSLSARINAALERALSGGVSARLAEAPPEKAGNIRDFARHANAGTVVATSILGAGDSIDIQFKVVDGATGEVIRSLRTYRMGANATDSVINDAVDPLLGIIEYIANPRLGRGMIPSGDPPRLSAVREIDAAIMEWGLPDNAALERSRTHLKRALQIDPRFQQGKLWLAYAFVREGEIRYQPAKAESLRTLISEAAPLAAGLSPFESALSTVIVERSTTPTGLDAFRKIVSLAPRSFFTAELASILVDQNRPREAMRVLRSVDSTYVSAERNRERHFFIGVIQHYLGDYEGALAEAGAMSPNGRYDINAMRVKASALAALGRVDELKPLLRDLPALPNDRLFGFAGDVLLTIGNELEAHGHPEEAHAFMEAAVHWFETRTPEEMRRPEIIFRTGFAYLATRRLDKASKIFDSLHAAAPDVILYMGIPGRIAAIRGDTAKAEKVMRELADLPALKFGGTPTYERAAIAANLHRHDEAIRLLQEAFSQGIGFLYRSRLHWFSDFAWLRDDPAFKALLTPQG